MTVSNSKILAAAKQLKARKARSSMLDFIQYTKPNYETGWFNELLCLELDNFLDEVERGLMPRLMVFAPPRSGKSEACSRRFPAYGLGKHPDWNFISCSYSSDLSNRMSRDCQRIIESDLYRDVFPGTRISQRGAPDSGAIRTAELWEVLDEYGNLTEGSYRSAGVNGGITGQGMNIGIIDDPAKDYKTASSAAYQESVMDWYDTTFWSRLDPKLNGILIILTRWHQKDLAGQLLKKAEEEGESFRVVSFPMEAEQDEYHTLSGVEYRTRSKGEILFPERMPQKFVDQAKKRGPLTWNALYQQRPTTKGGGAIQTSWFGYYDVLPPLKFRAIFVDTAQKKGEHNDYSVMEVWGLGKDGFLYFIDCLHERLEAYELEIKAAAFWKKHKPVTPQAPARLRYMAVEDKSSGTGLIQNIKRAAVCPVKPIARGSNAGNKAARLMDVQGFISSGYVKLPNPAMRHPHTDCAWVSEFLAECESFSMDMTHAHDDFIDPMVDAINEMLNGRGTSISDML